MGSILVIVLLVLLIGPILGIYAVSRLGRLSMELAALRHEMRTLRAEMSSAPDAAARRTAPQRAAAETKWHAPNKNEAEEAGPGVGDQAPQSGPEADPASAERHPASAPEPAESPAIAASTTYAQESASPPIFKVGRGSVGQVPARQRGILDELGARWSVWVGGIALALGAIFFLRYSIEAGFFGPATRVAVATLLGVLLLGAGEWLRRNGPEIRSEALKYAYIPGVLTAVGILSLLGSAYVSYAVYGYIGPKLAFGLLGLISLGALALGLLQGPAISGLGLVGSLVTPMLVSTGEPLFPALYTYLVIVTAGALALGRVRDWAWLSVAGTAGSLAWALLGVQLHRGDELIAWLIYLGAIFGLTIMISAARLMPLARREENALHDQMLPLAVCGVSAALLLIMLRADDASVRGLYACLGGAAVALFVAWRWSSLVWAAACAAALSVLAICLRGSEIVALGLRRPKRWIYTPVPIEGHWAHLFLMASITSAVLMAASVLATRRAVRSAGAGSFMPARIWALAGAVGPLSAFLFLWLIGARGETQVAFGLAGLVLAITAALATEWLYRTPAAEKEPEALSTSNLWSPLNLFAGSSSAATAFGFAAGLTGVPLALALIASILAAAAIFLRRPMQVLRIACAAFGVLLMLHVFHTVGTITSAVGKTAIFNELWLYFALPAAGCGAAAWLLSRSSTDKWSQAMEALALSFAALFAVFQVRHYMNGGNLFAPTLTLEELSMQVLVGLSFSFGLSRIRDVSSGSLFSKAAMLTMGISLLNLVVGSLLLFNPVLNAESPVKGGGFLNSLFLAYLLPGVLLAAITWLQRERRPVWYIRLLGGVSLVLLFAYLTAMVRLDYKTAQMMDIFIFPIGDLEIYAYTIVWCLSGLMVAAAERFADKHKVTLTPAIHETLYLGAVAALGLSSLNLAFGNAFLANPMLSRSAVVHGGPLMNSLLTAFLFPGLLLGGAARLLGYGNFSWDRTVRNIFGGLALLSVITYCTAMVRFAYHAGNAMSVSQYAITNAEQYTYSIVWLLFAILLLVAGMVLRSRELRVGSAAVMVLTVAKVFLVDMAALEGVLRALSFVGLGMVLIVMGFVYQRLLARADEPEEKAA